MKREFLMNIVEANLTQDDYYNSKAREIINTLMTKMKNPSFFNGRRYVHEFYFKTDPLEVVLIIEYKKLSRDKELKDLVFLFRSDRGKTKAGGWFVKGDDFSAITINLRGTNYFNDRVVQSKEDFIKNMPRIVDSVSRELLHELIHYFDSIRYKGDWDTEIKGSGDVSTEVGLKNYVNNDQEFNAYFQQGFYGVKLDIEYFTYNYTKTVQPPRNADFSVYGFGAKYPLKFKDFVAYQFRHKDFSNWGESLIPYMNDKYKRKFIKRLYLVWQWYMEKAYGIKK